MRCAVLCCAALRCAAPCCAVLRPLQRGSLELRCARRLCSAAVASGEKLVVWPACPVCMHRLCRCLNAAHLFQTPALPHRLILAKAREHPPASTARVWMKSAMVEREAGDAAAERGLLQVGKQERWQCL